MNRPLKQGYKPPAYSHVGRLWGCQNSQTPNGEEVVSNIYLGYLGTIYLPFIKGEYFGPHKVAFITLS